MLNAMKDYEKIASKNLFNINELTLRTFILTTNGNTQVNDNWCQSEDIAVEGLTDYVFSNVNAMGGSGRIEISEYTESKKWLRSRQLGNTSDKSVSFSTLGETRYIKLGIYKLNDIFKNIQLEKGSTAIDRNNQIGGHKA